MFAYFLKTYVFFIKKVRAISPKAFDYSWEALSIPIMDG